MKKLLYLSFLFIPFGGLAQQKIWLGPEFGLSVIEISNDQIGRSFQPGYFGGAVFEYRFNSWFGLKTGVNYAQKRQAESEYDTTEFAIPGFDIKQIVGDGVDLNTYSTSDFRYSQHYLEIPVFARFNWKEYYVMIGGYVGYQVSATRREHSSSYTPFTQAIDWDPILEQFGQPELALLFPPPSTENFVKSKSKSGLTSFDWGAKAGIGYQAEHFGFAAMYQYGIPDFRTSPSGDRDSHHYMQFSINYLFGLGKGGASSSSL